MTSRRAALKTLAGLGAAGATFRSRSAGSRADEPAPGVRTIAIKAREVTWELAPGRTVKAMAYEGRVPGPEIRVREGERVRVVLTNALAEPTTVHWHGIDVPNAMDGVADLTQKPVPPGETFVYEFDARPAGTRWYHTHFREHHQMDRGLVAPLVIEPEGPEPMAYGREVTLVLDDWATGSGPPVPPTREGIAGVHGGVGGMMSGRDMGGMMGRGGMMPRSTPHERAYDTMTINGHAYPAVPPLRVREGERVRLRLLNASNEHTHVVRLAGHRLHVTHTDGNPLAAPVVVDAIPIAPSERYDAVVVADRPGAWFFHCTEAGHAAAGERMVVLYDGASADAAPPPDLDVSGITVWHYGRGHGRPGDAAATGAPRAFELVLSGGMMGSDAWTINGKVFPHTEPLRLDHGERALVRFRNMSPEAHPMHLHGQSFRLLATNRGRLAAPLVKDTVDVEGHMGWVVLEFTAENPGDWLLHCHKPTHMDGGMATVVKIARA